jgi:Cu-Zn family superoxide dismutase
MSAVAVFKTDEIQGEAVAIRYKSGVKLTSHFTKLPPGKHGFHIHKAGDLRGEGCMGLCEHYDIGSNAHGGEPGSTRKRHTGDLGNIEITGKRKHKCKEFRKSYHLKGITPRDLWGRSIIVHKDEDDLGKGNFEDSKTTGHSGARIGCAIFGRALCAPKTRKNRQR